MTHETHPPRPSNDAPVPSVLLVDDHEPNLLALEAVLEPLALHLVRARSGTEALERLLRTDFAAILMDVQMPGMDGFETAALIRKRERTRGLPIVFITAIHRDEAHRARGYDLGAVDYLAKPIDPGVLRAKVAALVELWRRGEVLRRREAELHARERAELLARERAAHAEAEAQSRLTRTITDNASVALFVMDARQRCTFMNPAAEAMTGYTMAEVRALDRPLHEVIHHTRPDGRPYAIDECPIDRALPRKALEKGEDVFVHKSGRFFPVAFTASPILEGETPVGTVIEVRDTTEEKAAEAERERLLVAARSGEEQFRTLADVMPVLAWYAEPDGHIRWYNRRWYEYTGAPPAAQEGWGWRSVHDPADVARVEAKWRRALETGEPWEDVFRLRRHDGAYRWFLSRAQPLRDASGRVVRWFGTNADVHEQRVGAQNAAFLARASTALGANLDLEQTLESLTRLVVPERADWCAVYLTRDDGRIELAAVSHADASKAELLREMSRRYPMRADDGGGTGKAIGTGRAALLAEIDEQTRRRLARDETHLEMLRELSASSGVIAPLRAHGRTLGAVTLAFADDSASVVGRRFEQADVVWVEELARRLAIALDNARLFGVAQQERARAEEANRAKDLFLSTLSHELRTPINAVLGWSRMLRTGSVPEEKRERALEIIDRNAHAQVALIEDILDLSRIASGKLRLDVAPMEVGPVVEAALDTVRPAADARGVKLQPVLDPGAGAVHGDATRLQQVVWNLLSNAVKFTPRGGSVRVRLSREGSHVQVVVADTGRGIEPAFLPHVFEAFRQADASTTRQQGGLGLGLAIVKHLVELHGGSIWAESAGPGEGATFTVRIPVCAVRASVPPPERDAAAPGREVPALDCPDALEGLHVLVCDDEPDARELLVSVLEHCKARVSVAGSAAEAFEALRNARPDVLVSDIGMPGEDGYALIRRVRALPPDEGGRTPAVALTAYAGAADRTRALMAGFQTHVAKPVEPRELVVVIANLAGRLGAT